MVSDLWQYTFIFSVTYSMIWTKSFKYQNIAHDKLKA